MRDGLAPDGVILVVRSNEDLGGVLKRINWDVDGKELVPDKENEFQKGPELDCPAVSSALGVHA